MSDLEERLAVQDLAIRLFVATDRRDWPVVEECFTDPLTLDMTSVAGGEPSSLRPSDVTRAWADGFQALDHVHHQAGNFQVELDGESARLHCYGVALHHRTRIQTAAKTRVFVGTYDMTLRRQQGRWKIAMLRFNLKFLDGNLELEKSV
ncbi:MAG TPA: nuclear transport factor 2 family protein [Candidatus Eisenbacteria bacterium]|nr:nuclear transport factor 2 family protein [Candidatus Eisenbacteria bacterium]